MSGIVKVVIFRNGLAYVERLEPVSGNQVLELSYPSETMTSVLKTLNAHDEGKGTVASISYDNHAGHPTSLQLNPDQGAIALLWQLRGARLKVVCGNREISGRLVGVEQETLRENAGQRVTHQLSLADSHHQIHTFSMKEIDHLALLDPSVHTELEALLQSGGGARQSARTQVRIHTRGEGKRKVRVGALVEAPAWKTTYRLNLEKRAHFQAWAVVDNTTDDDWNEVQLSLVAGEPLRSRARLVGGHVGGGGQVRIASGASDKQKKEVMSRLMQREVEVQAESVQRGELCEYQVSTPVTVPRRQSALVPIAEGKGRGDRFTLVDPFQHRTQGLAAVRWSNPTGTLLETGPVVVYEAGIYAGEADLPRSQPKEKQILPFAVDTGLHYEVKSESSEARVMMVKVENGLVYTTTGEQATMIYNLDNRNLEGRKIVIRHRRSVGVELLEGEPKEKTPTAFFFELEMEAQSTTSFKLRESRTNISTVHLGNVEQDEFRVFMEGINLPKERRQMLDEVVGLQRSLAKLRKKLADSEKEQQGILAETQRLIESLPKLGNSHDEGRLRSRYVAKVEQGEDRSAQLAGLQKRLKGEIDKRETEFRQALEELEFEHLFEEA